MPRQPMPFEKEMVRALLVHVGPARVAQMIGQLIEDEPEAFADDGKKAVQIIGSANRRAAELCIHLSTEEEEYGHSLGHLVADLLDQMPAPAVYSRVTRHLADAQKRHLG